MAITIKQEAFEGPLDLLLHLIEKNKMSIYDIQISLITNQYMEYIEQIEKTNEVSLEGMSDFILMAATLLYIKSKMLLPKPKKEEDIEEDPRAELVQRLLEYKKMKYVSEELKQHEKEAPRVFFRNTQIQQNDYASIPVPIEDILDGVSLVKMYEIFDEIMKRKSFSEENKITIDYSIIKRDSYTIKEKSRYILDLIELKETITFYNIFDMHTTKIEMIVTFMALLELVHKKQIRIYQEKMLDDIWISGVSDDEKIKN